MKRLHLSVNVDDLNEAVTYYSALFGSAPGVLEADYARWRLDDPMVNFVATQRGRSKGVDHLGLDVESDEELTEVTERLRAAGEQASAAQEGVCCYHTSVKSWSVDPAGMAWETFHTSGRATTYGTDSLDDQAIESITGKDKRESKSADGACC